MLDAGCWNEDVGEEEEELGVLLASSSLSRRRLLGSPRLGDHNNHCKLTHSLTHLLTQLRVEATRQSPFAAAGRNQGTMQGTMQGEPPPIQNSEPPTHLVLTRSVFPTFSPPNFLSPSPSIEMTRSLRAGRGTPRSSLRAPTPHAEASEPQGQRQGDTARRHGEQANRRIGEQANEFDFSLYRICLGVAAVRGLNMAVHSIRPMKRSI